MNKRIQQLRKSLGLSQSEFGAALGVSYGAISKIESGANNVTDSMIKLICSTYHVNRQWLTEGIGDMFTPEDLDALIDQQFPDQPPFVRSIFKSFMTMPDEEWDKLKQLIDRIKKEGL